ncbi:MAG: hypothetical protein M1826_007670 [Phylliscum demangeonii]|nr:MAG: hypothetical protein M1826_007670 [Phylliscum demangeonii]
MQLSKLSRGHRHATGPLLNVRKSTRAKLGTLAFNLAMAGVAVNTGISLLGSECCRPPLPFSPSIRLSLSEDNRSRTDPEA